MAHDCDLIEDPDSCFRCKMRYVRGRGGLPVQWQGGPGSKGREFFHESTIAERQRQIVERAAANGWEARPLNPLYDRPANFGSRRPEGSVRTDAAGHLVTKASSG